MLKKLISNKEINYILLILRLNKSEKIHIHSSNV